MTSTFTKWLAVICIAIVLLIALTLGYITDCESFGSGPTGERLERVRKSANFDGERFVNLEPTRRLGSEGILSVITAYLSARERTTPVAPIPIVSPELSQTKCDSTLLVVWLGHSTVYAEIGGLRILTDPVFDDEVKTVIGHAQRFHSPPIPRDSLPHIDAVIISHDHHDHLEKSTVEYLTPTGTIFFVPLGVGAHLERWHVPDSQIVELDWWQSATIQSVTIICTPARHVSGRTVFDSDETLWASWVIKGLESSMFYGGDTGYGKHFRAIGDRFGPFDLSLLPIGAYDDNWPDIHLTPEEAVKAELDIHGGMLLPIHWGTFDVAFHQWDEPIIRLVDAAKQQGVRIVTTRPGEVVFTEKDVTFDHWWRVLR